MRDVPWPLTAALLAVMGLEVLHLFSGAEWARGAAHLAMGAVAVAAVPRLGLREAYLLAVSGVLAVLLWLYHDAPWIAARKALDQAVFLMAFVLLVSLIQEAAMRSQSVERLGTYLARQPGGRRFFGLFGGTMGMAVVFNISTVTLLAPLIRRGAEAAPNDPLTPVRERRQLNAHLRGFAWSVVWSPTAIAPLALMGLLPGADRLTWIAIGFVFSVTMMVIGWAEDRWMFRGQTAAALGLPPVERPPMPWTALGRFLLVCAGFAAMTVAVITATGQGVPASLMAAAPVLTLIWLIAMRADLGARIVGVLHSGLPSSAPMGVTLAGAGFIGIAGAELLPAQALADWLGIEDLPAWLFMLGTTLAVVLLSQFALSPIMMAVFFGAVLGSLPSLPASPTATALAVAAGWAVATTASPFASGVIMLSRVTGHSGAKLTYIWNGVYTILTVAALGVGYAVIAGWLV